MSPLLLVSLSFFLCALCGESSAVAAPQHFVPVNGAWGYAELLSIAEGRVTLRGNDIPVVYKIEDLVRWGHPVAPRAQTLVVLADGGRLVTAADWSGGAAVRLEDDDVLVLSDTWNEVAIPRKLVSGIVFAQRNRAEERERLVEKIRGESSPAPSVQGKAKDVPAAEAASPDAVLLTNGDRLTGRLKELERGSLTLNTAAGETKLPLSRVEAVVLGSSQSSVVSRQSAGFERSPSPSLQRRGIIVGMRDGSILYANAVEANQETVRVELTNGLKLAGGKIGDIVALQSLGGPFVYLSDLERADYRCIPYLSIEWPFVRDRNVLGGPLTVDGKRYSKGLGLHSAARLTYTFDENYQRFDAAVALDDAAKGRGSVVFGVYLQRDGQWSEAYKSGTVRGSEAPQPVSIDVRGAQGLTLTVDYADRGDELDYADWLDARLVR